MSEIGTPEARRPMRRDGVSLVVVDASAHPSARHDEAHASEAASPASSSGGRDGDDRHRESGGRPVTTNESLTTSGQITDSRWYEFDLLSAEGEVGGWGRAFAPSPAAARRFATSFLAGTSRVRLWGEADHD